MGNSIYGIAVSGLRAAQSGLMTTSHNIANVNTAGFSRQETVQATLLPQFGGSGYFGTGVQVNDVRRVYSAFLVSQARDAQSQAASSTEHSAQLASIDDLLADPSAGLSPALNDFFAGVQSLAANPADMSARQAMIGAAESLATRFRNLGDRLSAMRDGINQQVDAAAGTITAYAKQIADLNRSIAETQGSQGHAPNDLLDQRDALLASLAKEAGVSTVAQSDGTVNVYLGGRFPLVIGGNSYAVSAGTDPDSPRDHTLFIGLGAGSTPLHAEDIPGGRVGGMLAFRETDLAEARNALGRIALGLANDFNVQHQLGQDRTGAAGGAFFSAGAPTAVARSSNTGTAQLSVSISDTSALTTSAYRAAWDGANWQVTRLSDGTVQSFATLPQTIDGVTLDVGSGVPAAGDSFQVEPTEFGATGLQVLVRDPAAVAAAAPIRTSTSSANKGSGSISAGSVVPSLPLDANLKQTVTLTFTAAGTFDVAGTGTGNPSGVAYTSGSTISYNGWSVVLSGAPAVGDTFTISANTGGLSDNRNASLLGALQSARKLEGGTASYTDAYAQLVGRAGNRARELDVTSTAQGTLATQTQDQVQSVSGVNLDEEAANLIRFQQAYQAAGKALEVANTMFDALLQIQR